MDGIGQVWIGLTQGGCDQHCRGAAREAATGLANVFEIESEPVEIAFIESGEA